MPSMPTAGWSSGGISGRNSGNFLSKARWATQPEHEPQIDESRFPNRQGKYDLNIAWFLRNIRFSPMMTRPWRKDVALI